jgi:Secretion system C-terminal sorting domain
LFSKYKALWSFSKILMTGGNNSTKKKSARFHSCTPIHSVIWWRIQDSNRSPSIAPNPADKVLKINYSLSDNCIEAKFSIFDGVGRLVFEIPLSKGSTTITADISSLTKGIYTCKIVENKNAIWYEKLVVLN